jgi:hypothetical protein
MQTKTYTIYEYDELTPKAQEKARDWYIQENDYPFLSEYMSERAEELLLDAGFDALNIQNVFCSLSYCQGDGAMVEFNGSYDNKYIVAVKHSGHYYHERSTSITIENIENDEDADAETYEDITENVLVPLFKQLARDGYAYIDSENEQENVADNIRANGYTFDKDGNRKN